MYKKTLGLQDKEVFQFALELILELVDKSHSLKKKKKISKSYMQTVLLEKCILKGYFISHTRYYKNNIYPYAQN